VRLVAADPIDQDIALDKVGRVKVTPDAISSGSAKNKSPVVMTRLAPFRHRGLKVARQEGG
jgi:hypothetical protein